MIKFLNSSDKKPFLKFREKYNSAIMNSQPSIEAMSISSFNKNSLTVDCRMVNLKIVDNSEFIFFSNYNSPKSVQFNSHDQVALVFFWSSINCQIRIKGKIKKTTSNYNKDYFAKRSHNKNALAISSKQSLEIDSFDEIEKNFIETKRNVDTKICPEYWGGFAVDPYQFEFWDGHKYRLNKREQYTLISNKWDKKILQP